jgi:membrane protein implicated in regulation of membrane protease activity
VLSRRLRPYAWMTVVASSLGAAYAFLGILMVASLSGAPNYHGDASREALRWECALVVLGALAIVSVVLLVRTRRRSERRSRLGASF